MSSDREDGPESVIPLPGSVRLVDSPADRLRDLIRVTPPGAKRDVLADAANEIDNLRRWKAEALEVAARWEMVAAAVPSRPADVGRWKWEIVADELERLQAIEFRARLVVRAVDEQGTHPPHHLRMVGALRRTWPVLMGAIDALHAAVGKADA